MLEPVVTPYPRRRAHSIPCPTRNAMPRASVTVIQRVSAPPPRRASRTERTMLAPLRSRISVFPAVAATGRRGCPGGGHAGAPEESTMNALTRAAKSIPSEKRKSIIPVRPAASSGRMGRRASSAAALATVDMDDVEHEPAEQDEQRRDPRHHHEHDVAGLELEMHVVPRDQCRLHDRDRE